jgi:uncharacterized protein YdhG (YjbR/CyaY superfamily)
MKRDPTVKYISQLPEERRGQEMVLRQETQLATPEQQGSTIYATTGYYSQLAKTIGEPATIDWDTSYQSLLYCTQQQ